jgi:C-terminal processing protease CtpA/Prc
MRHLVLDVRNNPGGSLQVAAGIADEFLEKGRPICAMFSTNAHLNTELKAKREKSLHLEIPAVVLVNHNSSGASEVVAAALRDSQVAVILGEKTPGMGLVQNTVLLSDGSALNLTVAGLLTSTRKPIDGVGLIPDIPVTGSMDATRTVYGFTDSKKTHEEDSAGRPRDSQLEWAITFLKDYDSSKTIEQNIFTTKEAIGSGTHKSKDKRILWDKLETQTEEMLLPQDNMRRAIPEIDRSIREPETNDSTE